MKRITFGLDERGRIRRICADETVEVYVVDPRARGDRVHGSKVGLQVRTSAVYDEAQNSSPRRLGSWSTRRRHRRHMDAQVEAVHRGGAALLG